ncbi:hypothetical protein UFOVP577_2 [uncultured Caudovirales phage]|uniref:Glycine-rich domain-containing protein n=1 Tax=uncultured Caudovirales phage TaxID=2100421 RepID=A0A6J5MUV5_9CAUD|nr:hypothetical protein UFOVP577_2 [uncultured Caudovirales phage]
MTIAFNLSQLANYVDTSGKVDASAGLVNATPVANGGSGRSTQTAYAVLCGGTTSTAAQQSIASVGTTGQVLTSNGSGALPTFQTAAGGSPIATMDVKTTGTSATWTIPTGVTKVRVTVVGGGGSGNGAGGGGGGTAIKVLTVVAGTLTYTVGGAGASSQVSSGTNNTITTVSATAGSAGAGNPGTGGAGGIGSNGDLNFAGNGGGSGSDDSSNTVRIGGTGGGSFFGGGGFGVYNLSGTAGRAYGGGGSGGSNSTGGGGAAGVVIFEY